MHEPKKRSSSIAPGGRIASAGIEVACLEYMPTPTPSKPTPQVVLTMSDINLRRAWFALLIFFFMSAYVSTVKLLLL
jgi:hypothetical protein